MDKTSSTIYIGHIAMLHASSFTVQNTVAIHENISPLIAQLTSFGYKAKALY
jgi:hypothetical protein